MGKWSEQETELYLNDIPVLHELPYSFTKDRFARITTQGTQEHADNIDISG